MPEILTSAQTTGAEFHGVGRTEVWVRPTNSGTWTDGDTVNFEILDVWRSTTTNKVWVSLPDSADITAETITSITIPRGATLRTTASSAGYQAWLFDTPQDVRLV